MIKATQDTFTLPSMEVLTQHFRVEAFWDEGVIPILKDNFAEREFAASSLAHKLVIHFPQDWMAVHHVLNKLISSQALASVA